MQQRVKCIECDCFSVEVINLRLQSFKGNKINRKDAIHERRKCTALTRSSNNVELPLQLNLYSTYIKKETVS